ncbi:hypothetical protein ABZ678_37135 [Streptomyces hirsutus]|uniref:hypothetical protein n=1 Tax=Streptomyces hirsutus TaxID=35620 RepID=UPI0033D4A15D
MLEEPVRRVRLLRPGVDATPAFGFPAFLVGDPPPGALQVTQLHALQEAQQQQTRRT